MKDRYIAVVIILLLLLFFVVGVALMSKKIRDTRIEQKEAQNFDDACSRFKERDVTVYWIGEFPEQLKGISSKVRIVDAVTADTMPLKSPEFHSVEYDPDGNKVAERIPVDYTDYLYIVINRKELDNDGYSLIRECIMYNGVKTVVLGKDAIKGFRDFLILPKMTFDENDTMEYSMAEGSASHIFGDGTDFGEGTRALDLINYLLGDMDKNADRSIENSTDNSAG